MSHSEQVSFVVWFVHYICFIQVCQVKSTTGQDLEEVVMALLSENGLNVANIWGQGYDGAANMSASYKGLQARIQRQNEEALFVHCHAHGLNLVLVETDKSSPHFVRFFNLVERLYTFLSSSSKRRAAFIVTTLWFVGPVWRKEHTHTLSATTKFLRLKETFVSICKS